MNPKVQLALWIAHPLLQLSVAAVMFHRKSHKVFPVLFLLVFSKYLGVTWRQHSFGIALGFGSFASAELTLLALYASGHISQATLSLFNMLAYNGAIMIWLVYAWIKTPARDASSSLLM